MKKIYQTEPIEIEQKIYDILDELGIDYGVIEHEPLYTAEDLNKIKEQAPGFHAKNLFLRNAKGNKYYLLVTSDEKQVNLKEVKKIIGSTNLSFASEDRLMKVLKLVPGSVNPFSLINDEDKIVELYIEKGLLTGELLNFHPNVNYKTVTISLDGLKKYLDHIEVMLNEIEL